MMRGKGLLCCPQKNVTRGADTVDSSCDCSLRSWSWLAFMLGVPGT